MSLAWATDIHLDHLEAPQRLAFAKEVKASGCNALALSGDLAESHNIEALLEELGTEIQCPIYFIMGNHDYYHGSIKATREHMRSLTHSSQYLRWLPASGVVSLSPHTALVGHDGWSDAREGDFQSSTIRLKDYRLIEELAGLDKPALELKLQSLGQEAANELEPHLKEALNSHQQVFVLMHAPPFRDACRYQDQVADDNWAPHFICKALGDMLVKQLPLPKGKSIQVLSGHTHNAYYKELYPGLHVRVGGAEYGAPEVQSVFKV